jgi:hypothetical protein
MEINLTYEGIVIGKIYPSLASKKIGEIQGLLVPNEEYQKIRKHINKYFEIFSIKTQKSLIDRLLNMLLRRKYKSVQILYSKIGLLINDKSISNFESKIEIHDHLARTFLGNPIIGIFANKLQTDSIEKEIECFKINWKPVENNLIIEIKKDDKIICEV